jgi:exonuclease VII small subunit
MADGLKDIIASLEKQRVAIERALEALKEVNGSVIGGRPQETG